MKPNQKSFRIDIPDSKEKLKLDLYTYLNSTVKPENTALVELIELGMQVINGQYHDKELNQIKEQLNSVINNDNNLIAIIKQLAQGQSSIFDAITNQQSDLDIITKKPSKED